MVNYETVFIAHSELSEANVNEINGKITDLIKKHNGQIDKIDDWGIRKLGYTIKKQNMGHYICLTYHAETGVVGDLERTLRLREDILKQITVRLKEGEKV